MLQSLYIENMAVIRRAEVDFSRGFSAITGETGAGKSVMMESLRLLLGAKADKDVIRHGETRAEVSAVFSDMTGTLVKALDDLGVETDEEGGISLSRILSADGKSVSRINGRPVSLGVLKEAARLLFHIHGQEDTAFLRDEGRELSLLDLAAGNEAEKARYGLEYEALCRIRAQIEKLEMDESEKLREMEMLRYRIADIEEVSPVAGEEDSLFEEKLRLRHSEKISKQTAFAYRALRGAEKGNACYILDRAIASLRSIADVLPSVLPLAERLETQLEELEDVAAEIESLNDLGGEDPTEALDRVETRLAALARISRKYGGSAEKAALFLEEAKERLSLLENMEADRAELEKAYAHQLVKTRAAADALRETRRSAAALFEKEMLESLDALDLPGARLRVMLAPRDTGDGKGFASSGDDLVSFMVGLNPGEPAVSVTKCTSGGEFSRILLAIKTVIARHDGMPTLIFDEIDTGVSGKTSRKIGFLMKNVSKGSQIICITHSAQIASLADTHLLVSKKEVEGRTTSVVLPLEGEERVAEIARILGGISVTEAQKMAAADMLSGKE